MKDPGEGIMDNSRELSGEFSGNFSEHFSRGSTEFTVSSKDLTSSKNPIVLEKFHNGALETQNTEMRDTNRDSSRDIYTESHRDTHRESHSSQGDTYNSPEESHHSQRENHNTQSSSQPLLPMHKPLFVRLLTTWLFTDPSLIEKYNLPQQHNYQVQNHDDLRYLYICGGRLRTIRQKPVSIGCFVLMVVPGVLFYVFDAHWAWRNQGPAVVVLFSYVWVLSLSFFVIVSTSDAGVLSRNLHLPAGVVDHKLNFIPEEYFNTVLLPCRDHRERIGTESKNPSDPSDPNANKSKLRKLSKLSGKLNKSSREHSRNPPNSAGVSVKYCPTCHIWRPPRASHCGVCNSCIMNHDHHCTFLNNCVGTRNYKYFLWFLLTSVVSCAWLSTMSFVKLSRGKFSDEIPRHPITFLLAIYGCVGIVYVLLMLGFHIFLTANNITTREYLNNVFGKDGDFVNPFDTKSWWRNMYLNWWGTPRSVELIRRRGGYGEDVRFERVMRMQDYTRP